MEKELSDNEVVELYIKRIKFGPLHRILFFLASLSLVSIFIGPYFIANAPPWVIFLPFALVIIWNIFALPKHFSAMQAEELSILRKKSILATKGMFLALKPRKVEKSKFFWDLIYFFSLLNMLIAFLSMCSFPVMGIIRNIALP